MRGVSCFRTDLYRRFPDGLGCEGGGGGQGGRGLPEMEERIVATDVRVNALTAEGAEDAEKKGLL